MTDTNDSAPRKDRAADVRTDEEVRHDDPFARRRAMDDSNVPPEHRGPNEGLAGERGISPVAGRFSSPQAKMAGVAAMVGGAALLLVLSWDRGDAKPEKPKEPARQVVRYDEVATKPPPLPPAPTAGATGAIDPLTGQPLAQARKTQPAAPRPEKPSRT